MSDSCFIERLSRYVELTERERKALARLEKSPEELSAGEIAWHEDEPSDTLAIVQHGWLMSYSILADGARQILRLHFPGDLVGAQGIAFTGNLSSVSAISDSRLCRFPRAALGTLYEKHPRLAALFFTLGMVESVDLADRLRSLGRTSGMARLAFFFLSVLARKRVLAGADLDRLTMPLTQADIADMVGMTKVHVNRLLRQMEAEALIARSGRELRLLDEPRLMDIAHFVDRYHMLDTRWFPDAS